MVLEHHGVKQPAASQPTAASRPQRRRSCFGSRNAIFSMMPEHLNDGWRTTVVDVPAASGALSTPTPTPSPLTISPSSQQASMLLLLNLIESAEAPTSLAGWRRSFASLAMRNARRARRSRSGSSRRPVESGSSGRGGASGAAALPGLVHTCGSVGRFVWCVLSCHIIAFYLTSTTLIRRWEGVWDSETAYNGERDTLDRRYCDVARPFL